MGIEAAAGAKVGVTGTAPATYDADGYGDLVVTNCGLVGSVPEFGGTREVVKFKTLIGTTEKDIGSSDPGAITLPIAKSVDAGLAIFTAKAKTRDLVHICIETRSGIKFFNSALVPQAPVTIGGPDDPIQHNVALEFVKEWIEVAAS